MAREQQGFTLIELMIVVAIIGILASIAIPMYQQYVVRAQISDGLSVSASAKAAVSEYYMDRGALPTDNSEAGLAANTEIASSYVTQVTVQDGVIDIEYGGDANAVIDGMAVQLTPNTTNPGSITWACASAAAEIDDKYLPGVCR